MLDVAVIGGGPVGSRVAYQLASAGHRVAVLEKHPQAGQKPCCTGIVSRRCIEEFGLPEQVIYRNLNSASLHSPSGKNLQVKHSQPQAAIVNRSLFDRWSADRAQSQGAEYLFGCDVHEVTITPDFVEIDYQTDSGVSKIQASAVVLACGFNSRLVKQIGFGQPAYQVTGVQTEVETDCVEVQVYFDQKIAPGFFAWLAPTSPGRALAGLMARQAPGQHLRNWLSLLADCGTIQNTNGEIKQAGIPLKPLRKTAGERILVVGDAAGQVKPTTGGGIYFGMLCADIAAETLHKAITLTDYSSKILSGYEKEWRRRLQSELQREYWSRRAYQLLTNRQIDKLFDILIDGRILDSLMQSEYQSFDSHGGLVMKALKLGLVSQAKRFTGYLSR